jgi:hypothetical protein
LSFTLEHRFSCTSTSFCLTKYSSFHPSTEDAGLTIVRRLSGKNKQQQFEASDNQLEQYTFDDSQPSSVTSGFRSFLENRLTMQPTTLSEDLDSIDLTTENLPAVDTPDACDKAAVR